MFKKIFCGILIFVVLLSGCSFSSEPVYTEGAPEGYRYLDTISQIRVALPEEILEKQLDLSSISIADPNTNIRELAKEQYLTRYENYGFMLLGPDLFVLSAKDKNMFSMQLNTAISPETVQYILRSEVGLKRSISVTGSVRSDYNENTAVTKIIVPVRLSSFTFSNTVFEDEYEGYAALLQKEDFLSAVCIAVMPAESEDDVSTCETICQSFTLDNIDEFDSSSYYTTYSNILPSLSYEKGGLPAYDGYSYQNIGTDKMDATGTYNQINENLGMYCLMTDFGPLNLPYLVNDLALESSLKKEPFQASIHSSQDNIDYAIHVYQRDNASFDELVEFLRKQIQQEKEDLKKKYPSCKVISEDILDDSNAVITVCGWDRESNEVTTIYYKLNAGKDLYSITEIRCTQIAGKDTPKLLEEIAKVSGILLVEQDSEK